MTFDNIHNRLDTVLTGCTSILSIEFFHNMSYQDMQSVFTILMQGIVGAATLFKIGYEIYRDVKKKDA